MNNLVYVSFHANVLLYISSQRFYQHECVAANSSKMSQERLFPNLVFSYVSIVNVLGDK